MKALFLKRPFDISLSFLGIVLSFPLWIVFALMIWLEDRGPVFYRQERIGKNGKLFIALKFRSMIKDAEREQGPVQAKENDKRITKVGKFLRATAMDELPQLTNIFRGDMSFVGPRPLAVEEIVTDENGEATNYQNVPGFWDRLAARPGLTSSATIFIPKDTPPEQKFQHDLSYVQNQSFSLDLRLIALSYWISFRGKWESRQKKV